MGLLSHLVLSIIRPNFPVWCYNVCQGESLYFTKGESPTRRLFQALQPYLTPKRLAPPTRL
ncbi:hypothetical protein B9S53_13085 [Arthrospira sp. O9.13F]|nr:hypothetical protein B9S53_13085 [Arthrospira sp. O9.13F]